ncbi:hypothetical protein EG328_006828 [Venturia inaequalis]|uniref:Pectinesterase inhibitor domain-containing protein n=1 Tax=Venturia inaequalis TaxID=5025 RepID=A0A8H3UHF9_VENIN|nr:hypothetical protein EG328_006828 [Venturia inaequalis]KAE9969577.1 hypothetical protein EG327_010569 [Venturia inaequalis]RDI83065.1 hypothetical protein Vi05172_g7048 [Venturia inaequalis]
MNLLFSTLLVFCLSLANALITFEDIDSLAVMTTSCFKTISRHDSIQAPFRNSQHVIAREDHGQSLEIVAANALSNLNSNLTAMLDATMDPTEKHVKRSDVCFAIVKQHRALLTSTAWLLNTLDEKQQMNRWTRESHVCQYLSDTQALWASRRMNKQKLSFIEQQINLYRPTDCFAKNEVLRRGIEVVEYMNDILDSFL